MTASKSDNAIYLGHFELICECEAGEIVLRIFDKSKRLFSADVFRQLSVNEINAARAVKKRYSH